MAECEVARPDYKKISSPLFFFFVTLRNLKMFVIYLAFPLATNRLSRSMDWRRDNTRTELQARGNQSW